MEEPFHYRPSLAEYLSDKDGTASKFIAGCLDEMLPIVYHGGCDLSQDEKEALFQYLAHAMKDDQIRHKCPPTRFAFMLLKAYKDGKIDEDDLIRLDDDDDDILDTICSYDQAADFSLD